MTKVLYLSAGNPISPQVGMDLVSHEHLKELAAAPDLMVTTVSVAPGIAGQPASGQHTLGRLNVNLYVGDLLTEAGGLRRIFSKIRFLLNQAVPIMAYSFKSNQAAAFIKRLLVENQYDVILVDHYYTLANFHLSDIKKSNAKLIYISHDAMFPHIAEMAKVKKGLLAKAYYYAEMVRAHWVEQLLFKMASKVIHLSEYERLQVQKQAAKHTSLLPPISASRPAPEKRGLADGEFSNTVLFIGSPGHPPNAQAIHWILNEFAPVLLKIAPSVKLAIVGGQTDRLDIKVPNAKGHGFVSSETLQAMLASCICTISPVIHGRGIKVKVLDAIAAGCPVLAAEESLRGFEKFGLTAAIDVEKPEALALTIQGLVESEAERQALRRHFESLWTTFLETRTDQLAREIRSASPKA